MGYVFDKKQGVYCEDCGRQQADHCQGCNICDAVGLLCSECFKAEAVQHEPAKPASNQPKYVRDFLDEAAEGELAAGKWESKATRWVERKELVTAQLAFGVMFLLVLVAVAGIYVVGGQC